MCDGVVIGRTKGQDQESIVAHLLFGLSYRKKEVFFFWIKQLTKQVGTVLLPVRNLLIVPFTILNALAVVLKTQCNRIQPNLCNHSGILKPHCRMLKDPRAVVKIFLLQVQWPAISNCKAI